MDIRNVNARNAGAADEARKAGAVGSQSAPRPAPESSSDRVTLSERAKVLQETRRAALAVPEIRNDRVAELRKRLAEGSLVPDPDRIARALIEQGVLGS